MQSLRLGFIGAGEMAMWSVYPSLHFAPIRLEAVCDLDAGKAEIAAEKFGAQYKYTDYRQMIREQDLEAVIVQMHPGLRQGIVLDALDAGLHVFVPKPPSPSFQDCVELAQAARVSGKQLMVNFERRFSFAVRKAREIIGKASFGRLNQLSFSFCSGNYDEIRGRYYEDHIHAYLLDFALHHLDLARYLGGEFQELALFSNIMDSAGSFAVALRFASGAVGTMQLNSQRIWWRNYDHIELTGEGEYVVLDGLWSLKHYSGEQNAFTENYSDERSGELTGDAYSLIEFVDAIRQDREPVSSISDCVETMRLYQALYDAVRAGRTGVIPLTSNQTS
jgi:myo-inositol 2-dehydrogenase/D-chiro-inositol 1-dehydrogenase